MRPRGALKHSHVHKLWAIIHIEHVVFADELLLLCQEADGVADPIMRESVLMCGYVMRGQAFLQPERPDVSDSRYCGCCQSHVQADVKLDLWQLPEKLVIGANCWLIEVLRTVLLCTKMTLVYDVGPGILAARAAGCVRQLVLRPLQEPCAGRQEAGPVAAARDPGHPPQTLLLLPLLARQAGGPRPLPPPWPRPLLLPPAAPGKRTYPFPLSNVVLPQTSRSVCAEVSENLIVPLKLVQP